ncbi:undecaprenyl diphosphate synthase family protein [Clostridium botulinum]|uniref:Undecaprenyl diphosphate synthase family protein n=1 Tax=Clostridium botulinum TaxID=1491 RepID=A0A0L9Y9K2_CLOBO|nr:undecaprenyl diphosphate synthase family protein [Clostridium botulinum]KAI3346681.1 undecaprenyl diphosphate synthase family protein [Clostridium botulinum]KOM88184.1 dihydroorotate dehydrogenase [Clostridium botulinum]KOR55924.1 dihydroorotate dehydrogenase [Clostridium botulinum]MBN1036354.1 undecaprenyl diphosphate synthase family protein [Clostridium botulinum]MCS6111488.1 undecaprenyl diphosphate synthase family protein [Clostridium botulinum]
MRIPKHIGVIPDGNRRWALANGLTKDKGYSFGVNPGLEVFKLCQKEGISEVTFYGFTVDNTKRPSEQKIAFTEACIESVKLLTKENCEILVLGNTDSKLFPKELLPFSKRTTFGDGGIKVNFLMNYGWEWDLNILKENDSSHKGIIPYIHSKDISRIDLIIRWGGRRRLSGFLPAQCVYSDFYVIDSYWPAFKTTEFYDALNWYNDQDVTLGG